MEKKLFLDLEETLIEDWYKPTPLTGKINMIRDFAKENGITEATLFSAAVATKKEMETFDRNYKEYLEEKLNLKIITLSFLDIFHEIIKKFKISASDSEMSDILNFQGKEQAFIEMVKLRENIRDTEFILFDDTITDMDIFLRKRNVKITLYRV